MIFGTNSCVYLSVELTSPIQALSLGFCKLRVYYLTQKFTESWKKKSLSPQAIAALEKTNQYLSIGHYSPQTVRNYLGELRFIFDYYRDTDP